MAITLAVSVRRSSRGSKLKRRSSRMLRWSAVGMTSSWLLSLGLNCHPPSQREKFCGLYGLPRRNPVVTNRRLLLHSPKHGRTRLSPCRNFTVGDGFHFAANCRGSPERCVARKAPQLRNSLYPGGRSNDRAERLGSACHNACRCDVHRPMRLSSRPPAKHVVKMRWNRASANDAREALRHDSQAYLGSGFLG